MSPLNKVVIIEDKYEVVEAVTLALQIRFPDIKIFSSSQGQEGILLVEKENPQVIILDLGLPDISGFEVIKQVRLFSSVPILVLTIAADELDVVRALELGADEYVVKPFRPLELISRLEAVARRKIIIKPDQVIQGIHTLDMNSHILFSNGKKINLTRTESAILNCLLHNAGQVVPLSRLAEEVWGDDYPEDLKRLKVYIRRLRGKIESDPSNPVFILTRVGGGYYWNKSR